MPTKSSDEFPTRDYAYKVPWYDRHPGGNGRLSHHYMNVGVIGDAITDDASLEGRLFTAISNSDVGAVRDLLDRGGVDINVRNEQGLEPLHLAAHLSTAARDCIIEGLLHHGADPNAKNNEQQTFLHLLCAYRGHGIEDATIPLRMMLEHGAKVNEHGKYGLTPLHYAAWSKQQDLIQVLLENGADVHARCESGTTPFFLSCVSGPGIDSGRTKIFRLMLDNGSDVNTKDNYGNSAFHALLWPYRHCQWLSRDKLLDNARFLIKNGGDVNSTNEDGITPLHLACYAVGDVFEMVVLLLEGGAHVLAKDKHGATPLHWACMWSSLEVCKALVQRGGNVSARDKIDSTPLHWASRGGQNEVVHLLVEKGADLLATDVDQSIPMHWAAQGGSSTELVTFMLENGVDILASDKDGDTPLQWSTSLAMSRFLLDKGATKRNGFADWITPFGFPMALVHDTAKEPRSLLELGIMAINAAIRDKPGWWSKIDDKIIVQKWREEALAGTAEQIVPHERERQFNYALNECRWLSQKYKEGPAHPAAVDGVFARDNLDVNLLSTLLGNIAVLRSRPAIGSDTEDRHPGTPQMVNLVHPSLWCYEEGKTKVLAGVDADATHAPAWEDFVGCGGVVVNGQPGRPDSEHSPFQWLPSEFHVDATGSHCIISSYINSLHPKQYPDLYKDLAHLFCLTVPLFEEVLAEAGSCYPDELVRKRSLRIEVDPYSLWEDAEPRDQLPDETEEQYDEYMDEFEESRWDMRTFISPTVPTKFTPPKFNKERAKISLRECPLQVIVKIASLELGIGESYDGGTWHVEGTTNERIVATACCYLENTNVTGGELCFRTAVDMPGYEQNDAEGMRLVYGLEEDELLVQSLGQCSTAAGRILAWPNSLQHLVSPVDLADDTKPGKRTIVCFFLVDPTLRVHSTATVPPQQLDWIARDAVQLPLAAYGIGEHHITEKVSHFMASDSMLTYEMACGRRARLMEERGRALEEGGLAMETFNLCEH